MCSNLTSLILFIIYCKKIYFKIFSIYYIEFFISDSEILNILRHEYKVYKYNNKFRAGRLIINQNENITPEERMRGGYNINDRESVTILDTREIFNKTLKELTLSVPHKYKTDPVQLLTKKKQEILDLLNKEIIVDNSMTQFGLMIYFILKITKQTPGELEKVEYLYVNSHRYIICDDELPVVLDIVINWYNQRLDALLQNTVGSGWVLDSIDLFKVCYHKVYGRMRIGSPLIAYPIKRGKTQIFNPPSQNEFDHKCLDRCIAAFMIKKTLYPDAIRVRWDYITKLLQNPQNINKYMDYGDVDELYFDNLKKIEILNKIKINCYMLYKDSKNDRFNIRLMKRGNIKFLNQECNLLFYKYKRNKWHVFLLKVPSQQYLKNFLHITLKNEERICNYCFHVIPNSELLKQHKSNLCVNKSLSSIIEYPKPNEFLKFRNFKNCQKN